MKYSTPKFRYVKTIRQAMASIRKTGHFYGLKNLAEVGNWMIVQDEETSKDSIIPTAQVTSELLFVQGKARQFFLESESLYDFLSSQEVIDKDAIYECSSGLCVNAVSSETGEEIPATCGTIVFNIPNRQESPVFYIIPPSYLSDKFHIYYFIEGISGKIIANQEQLWSDLTPEFEHVIRPSLRLLMNAFMYMKAFPECVSDEAPTDSFEYRGNKSITIKTSERIVDRSGATPHFRRGHFRLLSSDRYKNKRGQVVFVHSSFVGGNAKTILEGGNLA